MNVLLLEPDRLVAKCVQDELGARNITVRVAVTADAAIMAADELQPDVVVSELSLPGHSATEFLYEFRTYSDWRDVPLVIYSSIKPKKQITQSRDWVLLGIDHLLYKPDISLKELADVVESLGVA